MTEEEWLYGVDAPAMLEYWRGLLPNAEQMTKRADIDRAPRKLWLFAIATCRRLEHLFKHEWHGFALDEMEAVADQPERRGGVRCAVMETYHETAKARHHDNPHIDSAVLSTVKWLEYARGLSEAMDRGSRALKVAWGNRPFPVATNANLVRDIVGNPFRPVAFDPAWRTEAAVGIAAKMYDERDFRAMPILADALEEAGCDSGDILSHCREPGVHVRGCWVADLVLGK